MAQLIIAAAGAAIGGALAPGVAFLGLTGASIGWTVGSLIGAQFGPTQRLKGPRLDDLKVTGVEYGQPIGWAAGHPRVAGQIWWASDKREIATTTEVGKGGGGAEVTSYTYEIDLLVGLLDRQIGGVSRVWANGKLVYTKLATSGTESALSSKSQTTWRRMTVYTGSETQLPDPTYETAVGVGYAPAYRDRGTVFIEGLQLGGSGQLPNLTFEVYMAGDEEGRAAQTLGTFAYTLGDDGGIPAMALPSFTHHIKGSTSTEILVYRYTLGLEEMELVTTYDMVASGNNPSYANSDVSGQFMVNIGSTAAYWYDDDGTGTSFTLPYNMNPATINVVFCRRDGVVLLGNVSKTAGDEKIYKGSSAGGTFSTSSAAMAEAVRSIAISGSNCYALNAPVGSADPTGIYVLDLATLTLQSTLTPPTGTDSRGQLMSDENDYLYCFTGSSDEVYRLDGGSTWTLVKTITGGLEYGQAGTRLCMVGGDLWCITMPGGGDDAELRVVFDSVTLTDATVQDTVDELCTRAGMPAGTWSSTALSAITTPVRALVVAQVAPVRSVLEQLASAYAFDAYCADKLYFVPRGGAVAATPGTNDLGCGEEEAAAELLPVRVQEDASIPVQISLSYLNADADYNTATEHSDRLATDASNTATVQLPMAFTAAEAKTICDVMLADAYTGRIGGEATLPLAYSRHTPTDVLTLTDADGTTYRARVVRREQAGPVVKLEWVLDDTTALVSAGITSDDYTPSLTVALPGPTALTLLDIPILRDADDSAGIYAAAKPTGTVWPGAKLMTSVAGGDYTEAGSFTSRAVVGETTVALTNWTGGNVFDEGGSVTVDVGAGELSSSTRDALLNTDANAMLVGSEIIQFRIATLVSAGVYKLTGLLRGRRGTEHAMTGHAIGETVVLLRTAGLLRVSYDAARIGTSADYKAVTLGKTLASATTRSIVDSGVALKPFAPVNLRQSVGSAGQYSVTWDRRSRLSYRWPSTSSLPLGENDEEYSVELLNLSDAVIETQAVTAASVTFSAATRTSTTLSEGIGWLAVVGGSYYGIQAEGLGLRYVLQINSAGVVTASSPALADTAWCLHASGTDLYVSTDTLNSGTPATILSSEIYRLSTSDITTLAATYTMPSDGDCHGLVIHGGSLWAPGYVSGNLHQLNATTLASIGTTAIEVGMWGIASDGTWLFVTNANTGDVFAYLPGTGEQWRVSPASSATDIIVTGAKVFVACGDRVVVLSAVDGSTVADHTATMGGAAFASRIVAFGSYVAFLRTNGAIAFIDTTSGDIAFEATPTAAGVTYLAGADGSTLWTIASPTLSFTDYEGWGYTLETSLAGYTVRVYQLSATVGRGYPAEITLT